MKIIKMFAICWIAGVLQSVPAMAAPQPAGLFMKGVEAYHRGDYSAAAEHFTRVADGGVHNGKLYYNIGNAFFKAKDIGRAILWYDRAEKLIPHDPDLKFNLAYATTFVKDEAPDPESALHRVLFFWDHWLDLGTVVWAALALNAVFWLLFGLFKWRPRPALRTAAGLLGALAVLFASMAGYKFYKAAFKQEAVVLPAQISVRSGLSKDATELFTLHAGTKVTIQKRQSGFVRIYFTDGKIGWVAKNEVGEI